MGLLDQVIGGVTGNPGGNSPIQNILANLLGGGRSYDAPYGRQGPYDQQPRGGLLGGLSGLLSMFQNAGLGHIAQSWINDGPNQSVSPNQLQNVFGEERVQDMADQAGMPRDSLLNQLSQHLPRVVDGLTPNGRLPEEGTLSV